VLLARQTASEAFNGTLTREADRSTKRAPKQIAKNLNREGVRGPRGTPWGPSTIYGNPKRGTGILHNELYIGAWSGTSCAT
jgi:hypothetical protein